MKKSGIVIGVICLVLFASNISTGVGSQLREKKAEAANRIYQEMEMTFSDETVFEYSNGQLDPLTLVESHTEGEVKCSVDTVDLSVTGLLPITYTLITDNQYGGKVEKTFFRYLEVQDTNAPQIEFENSFLTVVINNEVDIMANIVSVSDVINGELEYAEAVAPGYYTVESNVNIHDVGSYKVKVTAMDNHGNETVKSFDVLVNFGTYDHQWNGEKLTARRGTIFGPSGKETYYNLNMDGVVAIMRRMGNNDPYWIREDGCKMLGDYIMVAANLKLRPRGTIVQTSLGLGIVCDTGGFAYYNPYQLDIAVNW